MAASTATGLAITNPLVKYRALLATRAIAPDPVCTNGGPPWQGDSLTDIVTGSASISNPLGKTL